MNFKLKIKILLQTYSVRRVEMGEKRNVYVTVAFAGVALMVAMVIGVVVMRRRSARYPQHQVCPHLHHLPSSVHTLLQTQTLPAQTRGRSVVFFTFNIKSNKQFSS